MLLAHVSDAARLPQRSTGGGATLEGVTLLTHRTHRGGLREPLPGQEVLSHRHGVVGVHSHKPVSVFDLIPMLINPSHSRCLQYLNCRTF